MGVGFTCGSLLLSRGGFQNVTGPSHNSGTVGPPISSGNPGRFQTLYQGNVCHVFPLSLLKKDGTMVSTQSVLDARISFPVQPRTLLEVLQLIFQLVEAQTKSHIDHGNPNTAFRQVSARADNSTARDALMAVLDAYDAGTIVRVGCLSASRT